ncbi:3-methyl-2-oxobutanoate hydroxymethyltransferase [Camelliibacillus cellulosilyticus]|uniref:3-methyl-2-oxobutanoate hydroxymethyltransferase n=1 Tax=Camelliibacillus cellulosilyticus TaxID=2174486 RepID=A0ABV9GKR7_9BACL
MKNTASFKKMKREGEKIAMMTAYDYPSAKLLEAADIDMILVGDSVGMVTLGYDSTIPVTIDDMVRHTKAVRRGAMDTFIVTDMPFMTYHSTVSETLANAKRLMQEGGAHAIKLEGSGTVIEMIERLTEAGAPVVAHLGLTPQSVGVLGGYKVQGKDVDDAKKLMADAQAVERAGAFALVLECVPRQLSAEIAKSLSIPVIGIGAGSDVDGQVLVFHDVVGFGVDRLPKFVKPFADISGTITKGVGTYIQEVKSGAFPDRDHAFEMKDETVAALYGGEKA